MVRKLQRIDNEVKRSEPNSKQKLFIQMTTTTTTTKKTHIGAQTHSKQNGIIVTNMKPLPL